MIEQNLLDNLPESRATQRLLDVIDRLEAYHANLAAVTSEGTTLAAGSAVTSELSRLRQENKQLKTRQRHAVERLDTLLEKLPALDEAFTTLTAEEAA